MDGWKEQTVKVIQGDLHADTVHGKTMGNILPSAERNSTGFFSCLVPMTMSRLDQGRPERP